MAQIENIQTGSVTIVNGDGGTKDITISAVVLANSIVTYSFETNNNVRANKDAFRVEFTSTTNIRFTRFATAFLADVTVNWEVTEFVSGEVSVQAGNASASANPTDVTISTIDTAMAVPILSFYTDLTFGMEEQTVNDPNFTSATNLRLDFGQTPGTNDYNFNWQVLEYNADVSIQTGTISRNNGPTGYSDVTITSVDEDKSWVTIFSWATTLGSPVGKHMKRGYTTSATNLRIENGHTGTSYVNTKARWYLVEFEDDTSVQHGETSITSTNTLATASLTTLDLDNSSLLVTNRWDNQTSDSSTNNSQDRWCRRWLSDVDEISFERWESDGALLVSYHVIEWDTGAVSGGATAEHGVRGGLHALAGGLE